MTRLPVSKGATVVLHDLGAALPDAPLLLLCHATGFHAQVWRAVASALPDHRCVALDFRGYGDATEPSEGELVWEDFADDVLAVVDHLGGGPLCGAGHSMGGAGLLLAEESRPGTFERLVCFEPIVFPPIPAGVELPENPLAAVTRHRRVEFDSHEDAIERFGAKPPLHSLRPDVLDDYVRHGFAPTEAGTVRLKAARDFEARTYEMGSRHGGFARLGEVDCPVLVVAGGDLGGPAAAAPTIAAALPDARFETWPDNGHFGPLEDPDRFAAAIASFCPARSG